MLSPKRATERHCASCQPAAARVPEPIRATPSASPPWPPTCVRPRRTPASRLAQVAAARLPSQPHPRLEEAELAVAVRRLMEVHEVHVDLRPGQIALELRVQVQEGFLQRGSAPGRVPLRAGTRRSPSRLP